MRGLSCFVPLCLLAAARSQPVVLPSLLATMPPPGNYSRFNWPGTLRAPASRSQLIYDVNDIPPSVAIWSALQLRRHQFIGSANPALSGYAVVIMALSDGAPLAPSSTFATNLPPLATTVFTGTLSLSASEFYPYWPASWEAPVLFATPFLYIKPLGRSLVIDLTCTFGANTDQWHVEQWSADHGRYTTGGVTGCSFGNGSRPIGVCNALFVSVGYPWRTGYSVYPSSFPQGVPGVAVVGARGPGGTWAGLTLPIAMAAYGAPGCLWGVSADLALPLTISSTFYCAQPATVLIPNNPALAGASFYDQGFFLDPTANALGAVSSTSTMWTIGDGKGGPGSLVNVSGPSATTATSGDVFPGMATTVQLY